MKYVVYLIGGGVWNNMVLHCIVDNIEGSILERISDSIESKYHIHVYEFVKTWEFFRADTSREDIAVIVEKVPCL